MNYGQMQTQVVKILGNIESTDPWYSYIYPAVGDEATSVIWQAANSILRLKIGANASNWSLFPELKNTWTVGPTVAGANSIPRPSDCIVVTYVESARQSTLPAWETTKASPVNYIDPVMFDWLDKNPATMPSDYARVFTRKAKSLYIHPTPDSTTIDYLRLHGIAKEAQLSNAAQSLFMDEDFHPLVVRLAASKLAGLMGWSDVSKSLHDGVMEELELQKDFTGEETFKQDIGVRFDFPTREDIYQ